MPGEGYFLLKLHLAFAGGEVFCAFLFSLLMPRGSNRAPDGWWQRLSGVLVHRPRCGHVSSSFVCLDHRSRLEGALAALGAEDVAAQTEVEAALERAREEKKAAQSNQQARWSPDAVLEHARCKVRRFEEALKAMGDMQGPEVEFLQDAMQRARQAAQERPLASQMSECRKFIERLERRLEKIDAERAAESAQFNEARSRLTRLEAQASVLPPDIPRPPTVDVSVELEDLRAKLVSTERERDEALSAPACKRQQMSRTAVVLPGTPPPIPNSFALAKLSAWMDDHHAELFAAVASVDQR